MTTILQKSYVANYIYLVYVRRYAKLKLILVDWQAMILQIFTAYIVITPIYSYQSGI